MLDVSDRLPKLDLLAVDPGESTGLVGVREGKPDYTLTLDQQMFYRMIADGDFDEFSIWVTENFVFYPWMQQRLAFNNFPSARCIGAMEMWCQYRNFRLVKQMAGTAKGSIPDNTLRAYGWFHHSDSNHIKDAKRHALYYLLNYKGG